MNRQIQTIRQELLLDLDEAHIFENHNLAPHTTMKVGGPAALFVCPGSTAELFAVLSAAERRDVPRIVMGNGSNLIFDDEGYDGIAIHIGAGIDRILIDGRTVFVEAGALLSAVSRRACEAGLTGMEFASGIPGSIGGAIYMNAGAYGGEMAGIVHTVSSVAVSGTVKDRRAESLAFGYRTSAFQQNGETIFGVKLLLEEGDPAVIRDTVADYAKRRAEKQPQDVPSCGSFFKRPPGHFAGRLIEDAGLKGLSCGGASVSGLHAGFIVNNGGATAQDIADLMRIVQETVFAGTGVLLEPEVRLLCRDGSVRTY